MPQYFYNDQNITIDILLKIEHVVRILSEKYKSSFDDLLEKFYSSNTFRALKNPATCMWAECAEFIVDEFEREHL